MVKSSSELRSMLRSIDHRSYPAYKSLKGIYQFDSYQLSIDHVQGDPFAAPSSVSVRVPLSAAKFPDFCLKDAKTKMALADYLTRQFGAQAHRFAFRAKGSGKSGLLSVSSCGPEVLARTACEIGRTEIIVRFAVGFPASGRTIQAGELEKIFFEFLPVCVRQALYCRSLDPDRVRGVIWLAEDQAEIRRQLAERKLAAFVADGAVLPRESGISSAPMKEAVPFVSPESLRVTLALPHRGEISGMGIPAGITLIAGGGYHGKSTLLQALDAGVYNHIAGDGREYVITDETAVKLRSEDGRFIRDVDISLFIHDLPNGKDTKRFSTEDASGSTSQAAGLIEGIEAGSRVILMDEDTSATNFMVRDAFMQRVVSPEKEPITPFLERARDLYRKAGVSTILVAGSSGAFFHIADTVIQMDGYRPRDITEKVKALCAEYPLPESAARPFTLPQSHRVMTKDPAGAIRRRDYRTGAVREGSERLKVKTRGRDGFQIGRQDVDLRYIEQIVDSEQTAALGLLLKYAVEHLVDGRRTLPEIAEILEADLRKKGLSCFSDDGTISGGYAVPRPQEIYACLNRYRRQ